MKTDPFTDTWSFLMGAQDDQVGLGSAHWPFVVLYWLLLLGSVWIAFTAWGRDPAQRRMAAVWTWGFRVLMGSMWFQGCLWKLPLPVSGGMQYWTGQMAEHAAFPFYAAIVTDWLLPHMAVLDPLVFVVELGMAISFLLGLLVRPVAWLGVLYVAGLWIGLYRHPGEWPWEYVFIGIVHGMFAVHRAGDWLGLDGLRRMGVIRRGR